MIEVIDCPTCDAQGELPDPRQGVLNGGDPRQRFVTCHTCHGECVIPADFSN